MSISTQPMAGSETNDVPTPVCAVLPTYSRPTVSNLDLAAFLAEDD